jgi:hypothetical protein
MPKKTSSKDQKPAKIVTTITITRSLHKAVRQESIDRGVTASSLYEEAAKRLLGIRD